jgi:hypothetical protein
MIYSINQWYFIHFSNTVQLPFFKNFQPCQILEKLLNFCYAFRYRAEEYSIFIEYLFIFELTEGGMPFWIHYIEGTSELQLFSLQLVIYFD